MCGRKKLTISKVDTSGSYKTKGGVKDCPETETTRLGFRFHALDNCKGDRIYPRQGPDFKVTIGPIRSGWIAPQLKYGNGGDVPLKEEAANTETEMSVGDQPPTAGVKTKRSGIGLQVEFVEHVKVLAVEVATEISRTAAGQLHRWSHHCPRRKRERGEGKRNAAEVEGRGGSAAERRRDGTGSVCQRGRLGQAQTGRVSEIRTSCSGGRKLETREENQRG